MSSSATEPPPTFTGVTEELCRFLASATLDDIPQDVIERGKHLILDGIGCGLLAAQLEWSQRAVDVMTGLEGDGPAAIWGWERATSPSTAALLNGTFIQGFELDDYHQYGPLHSEACVIPSVLGTAEHLGGVDGRRFLEAVLFGFEIGPRVGIALGGLALVSRGWHCGAVYGALASAAGAGKLRGLDAEGFEDAIGIAATHASGLMSAQYEAMVKRMHSGMAARNGLVAAALADGGFSGIKRVIERDYGGFALTFTGGGPVFLEELTKELGQRWEISRIAVKPPYACMGGLHSTIDAARAIREHDDFEADAIASIDIHVAHAMYHHAGWKLERPPTTIGAQMNLGYAVAVALLDGAAFVPQFSPDRLNADDVWCLIERTSVHHDEHYDELGDDARWTSRVRVTFDHGRVIEVENRHPWSGRERPMTHAEMREKFWLMANLVMDEPRARDLEGTVMTIESVNDISELRELVSGQVRTPY